MTKRVQLVRHDNAGTQLFLGKLGELTVNTGNKSVVVHDGINLGGTEQARADLNNVAVAAASNAGKMSAQMSVDLAQALLDIVTNATNIASNDTDITALQTGKADKLVPATANNFAMLDASGNLADSGKIEADFFLLAGGNVNSMLFYQAAAPTGWTINTTLNDRALRIDSANGGVTGGVDTFSAVFAKTSTDSYTLLEVDVPIHDHGSAGTHAHNIQKLDSSVGSGFSGISAGISDVASASTAGLIDNSGAHTHASFGGGGGHSHGLSNFNLAYANIIVCSKD